MDFLLENGWNIFIAVDLLIFFVVIYFVKERQENKRIQGMQSDQVSLENRTTQSGEVTETFQEKKPSSVSRSSIIDATGKLGNVNWSTNKKGEILLTESMIEKIKTLDTMNPFLKSIIMKVVPDEMIKKLMEKALRGELRAGMKARVQDGELYIDDHIA